MPLQFLGKVLMRLLRLVRSPSIAVVFSAVVLVGCSLPQGVLLPDLPPSEKGTARGPSTVQHGAEGRSSQRGFIWEATPEGERQPSSGDVLGKPRPRTPIAEAGRDGITLNLLEASVADAAKVVLGDLLKVNYIIDSRVKGSVTVQTTKPVRQQAVLDIFDAVLSGQGIRIVVDGDLYKIVPASEAPAAGAPLRVVGARFDGKLPPGVSIYVIPLTYVGASDIEQVLKSVTRENAILRVDAARNLVMLSATSAEMAAILEIIDVFDVDAMRGMAFALFPVDSADPNAVAQELDALFANDTGGPTKGLVRFLPNRRLKAVLAISQRPEYLRRAGSWIETLQSVGRAGERQIFSYKVRNRPAGELAQLLLRVYGGGTRQQGAGIGGDATAATSGTESVSPGTGTGTGIGTGAGIGTGTGTGIGTGTGTAGIGTGTGTGTATLVDPSRSAPGGAQAPVQPAIAADTQFRLPGAAQPGEERTTARSSVSVVPDEANRMLLITATRDEYRRILGILDRIDTLPDQVLIEATIAEVTLRDELRMGVRWFFEKGPSQFKLTDSLAGIVAPNFPGFSYFLNTFSAQIVLDALSDVTDVNIVSSPTLTVLDGKRAVLQVGDEVPIITQQAVGVVSPGAPVVNSVTYRNTGIILGIVPRINDKGRVVLEVEQEASEVSPTTSSTINSPTIQQRRIKTTVAVKDGESLTLGGLMQDRTNTGKNQLPILGEVPVLGNLFKSKDDVIKRTELLILITPRVVRDPNQVRLITDEFRDRMNFSLRPQRQGPPKLGEKLERINR